jgi:hypothetical protein
MLTISTYPASRLLARFVEAGYWFMTRHAAGFRSSDGAIKQA